MLTKRIMLSVNLICGLLLNFPAYTYASSTIKIAIDNPQNIPFTFTSNNYFGNVCVSQNSNSVLCTITNTNPPNLFLFSLQWLNSNNPDCGINVDLFGGSNTFYFNYDSDYYGSFTPQTWDGKSDVNATLTITSPRINGC